ncbi:hypothetical protein SAY87_009130 [Trapa incisa]|uniref:BTB/POZ and TAZ domain-containing protein 4 n=1 Tax=Trapa incisa TaxID=236973 RepID=A0AAN7PXB2_9MYRT|nr:hypothetical protein SAY87_009130 [Trapa incisa]
MGEIDVDKSLPPQKSIPAPPPLPCPPSRSCSRNRQELMDQPSLTRVSSISTATENLLDSLFDEGYKADVKISTDGGGLIYAHTNVLSLASAVMKEMLRRSKKQGRWRSITIRGVPPDAVRVFVRFLYSSRYERDEMEEFVLHLLVLSHAYVVPQLKRKCEWHLEKGLLNLENVTDVFQLALLCDTPRLSLICLHMIKRNIEQVSATEGWKVMKQSHPILENTLMDMVMEDDNGQKERVRKGNERKVYCQLFEAMEALVHICREGCRTIGPRDRTFKGQQPPCSFEACRGLELLLRHFASCKLRVPGGCLHCRRTWQLLELHSRLCADPFSCGVPLCRNLKEKMKKQNKKDEVKWKMLVRNILRTKGISWAHVLQPESLTA